MKRLVPSLTRLALVVWLACVGLLALLVGMVLLRFAHPHFLPVTLVLGIEVGAGLALGIGATWRIIRGPERLRAWRALLVGGAPLLFLAGYFLHGLNAGLTRQFDINWPIKFLMPLGESLMDLEARFVYPVRTVGDKVVMISTPFAEAKAKVDAMDQHVRDLERRLGGKTTTFRVHWTRGPLTGMDSKAIFGLCMASRPEDDATGPDELTNLDCHEVAHVVMTSVCPVSMNPPALLLEGWAEANCGIDPTDLALRAWKGRNSGTVHTLAELTGPAWYGRHEWPVYLFGGPLSNFLLDTYGPDRYWQLYVESRPESFPDDCKRILGITLDQLDANYWAYIEQKVAAAGDVGMRRLTRMKLGPKVDPEAWKAFLERYREESRRLLALYQHVRLKGEFRVVTETGVEPFVREMEYCQSGPLVSSRFKAKSDENALLANPRRSIQANRASANDPWEVRIVPKSNSFQRYLAIRELIDQSRMFARPGSFLFDLAQEISEQRDAVSAIVSALESETLEGRPVVRLVLENPAKFDDTIRVQRLSLAADDHLAPLSYDYDFRNGRWGKSRFEYDRHDGLPVLRKQTTTGFFGDGKTSTRVVTVLDRQFGPIPEAEFDPERFLDGPIAQRPVTGPVDSNSGTWARWYWVLFVFAGSSLVGGMGLNWFMGMKTSRGASGQVQEV